MDDMEIYRWGFVVLPAALGSAPLAAIGCGRFQHEEVWRVLTFLPPKTILIF